MIGVASLFPRHRQPVVVSDSSYVRTVFKRLGFDVIDAFEAPNGLREAIFIPTDEANALPPDKLENLFGNAAVLVIPLVSFAAGAAAIDYLAKRIVEIDFAAACEANSIRIGAIESGADSVRVTSGCPRDLVVSLGSAPEIFAPKLLPSIAYGEWIAISQFLEVALIPNESDSSFKVDGMVECDAVSVAYHSENWREARGPSLAAWDLFQCVRSQGGFPLTVTIANSVVTSVATRDGEPLLSKVLPLTDSVREAHLIEMSFAALPANDNVDWTVNSQINEASGGVHVALGSGVRAAHIDFISSEARALF